MEKRQQQLSDDPLKEQLEDILLDDSYPPLSLGEVATYLGYSAEHMNNRYPTLCSAITKRHNQLFDTGDLRGKLEAALLDDVIPPPSVQELAKRFGVSVPRLRRHFPDLCTEIAHKYQEHRKNRGMLRLQHIQNDVKDTILCLHTGGCYPSLRKVRFALQDKKYWIKDINDEWRKIMLELQLDKYREPNH